MYLLLASFVPNIKQSEICPSVDCLSFRFTQCSIYGTCKIKIFLVLSVHLFQVSTSSRRRPWKAPSCCPDWQINFFQKQWSWSLGQGRGYPHSELWVGIWKQVAACCFLWGFVYESAWQQGYRRGLMVRFRYFSVWPALIPYHNFKYASLYVIRWEPALNSKKTSCSKKKPESW